MALAGTTVWEVRDSGHTDNPGGFNPSSVNGAGTDYSQQAAAQATFNGTTVTASNAAAGATITLSGYTVATTDRGNLVRITGGTNFTAGIYEVIQVNVGSNTWTLDRNCTTAAGSGMTGRMGGAVSTPGRIAATLVPFNKVWVKKGSAAYVIDNATANTLNSEIRPGGSAGRYEWEGYDVVRGDRTGNRPIIQSGANSRSLFNFSSNGNMLLMFNFEVDGNRGSFTLAVGVSLGTDNAALVEDCIIKGCGQAGVSGGASIPVDVRRCVFTNNTLCISGLNMEVWDCEFYSNVGTWCIQAPGGTIDNCLFYSNTSSSGCVTGNTGSSRTSLRIRNTTFWSNSGTAVQPNNSAQHLIICENCLSESNATYGFDGGATAVSSSSSALILLNCATYGNSSGATRNIYRSTGLVTLTASALNAPGGGDFSLNSAAGGGALCKQAGYAPSYPRGLTSASSAPNIGAWQNLPAATTVGWPSTGMRIPWQQ